MQWRVGISTNKGRIEAKNFNTIDECFNYILCFNKDELIIHYRLQDETGKLIETEKGKQNE